MSRDPYFEEEITDALFRAVAGLPVEAPDPEPLRRIGRRRRNRRRAASAGGVLLTVAGLAIGIVVVSAPDQAAPRPYAVKPTPTPSASASPTSQAVAPVVPPTSPTSTVDPTAPIRLAYANAAGVWIQTFDPATHAKVGTPLKVASIPRGWALDGLQFSPQGRYLAWQVMNPSYPSEADGTDMDSGVFDGETGRTITKEDHHVLDAPVSADGMGLLEGLGGSLVSLGPDSTTTKPLTSSGDVPTGFADHYDWGALIGQGSYPGGILAARESDSGPLRSELFRIGSDGVVTPVITVPGATSGPSVGTDTGLSVFATSQNDVFGDSCSGATETWTVTQGSQQVAQAVFTLHPQRTTLDLSVSPDGVVGGVVRDCTTSGKTSTSFVELDGSIAHTVVTGVTAARRGPDQLLAETLDGQTRVMDGGQSVARLGAGVTGFAWGPEHRP